MTCATLGDVSVKIQDGPFGSNLKSSHYVDEGVRVVRLQNIGSGHFDDRDQAFISPEHFEKLQKHKCEAGDILVATLGDPILRAAIQPQSLPVALNKADCIQLRCDLERAFPEYVTHYLNSSVAQAHAAGLAHGQTRPRVNLTQLRRLPIPLPPIEEQRRIAKVLDAADELRANRRQAIAQLDSLTQAVFIDMFGDLATNSLSWPVHPFSDFVDSFEAGKSVAAGPDDDPGGFRVLKVSAVTSRQYRSEESKPVPAGYEPPFSHIVRPGDLLFSRANTTELVGACAFVRETPDRHLLPDKLWRFVWKEPATVEPLYIWKALQNRKSRHDIGDLATGSSGSMKNISQRKLMGLRIPVPPAQIQREFRAQFDQLSMDKTRACASASLLDNLFGSLQQRAFRGEL